MAALEEALFSSGLPVEALMEKAALALSRRILAHLREAGGDGAAPGETALVLVGPGHNGGDGLVIARELHHAGVAVRLWTPFSRHRPLTEAHLRHAAWLGIPMLDAPPDPGDGALWIDALFGNGQRRAPGDDLEGLFAARQSIRPGRLVAIDVPSGLCSDSGRPLGSVAARAELTLCLGLLRQGLVQDSALAWVGRLERLDLDIPPHLLETLPEDQPLGLGAGGSALDLASLPMAAPDPAAGKYARGRLLVIAGSARYPGAAHLALAGAGAVSCGSIRALVPDAVATSLWQSLPHVVLEQPPLCGDALDRLDAVVVGPGLGAAAPAPEAYWPMLQAFPGLLVIDADGLGRIDPEWLRLRRGPTWLTPHGAEFARLFPDLAGLPPLEAAPAAARACGASVVLKGARSVIAAPDGRRWQLLHACPAAARAGLGDVLAGYAGGLAAATAGGQSPGDGALLAAAALSHALAGCAAASAGHGRATPLQVAAELARGGGEPASIRRTIAAPTQQG